MTDKEKPDYQKRWKDWFKEICKDLYRQEWYINVYQEIKGISKYPELSNENLTFYNWLLFNYYEAMAMNVRRLADKIKRNNYGTISFVILINDICEHYEEISTEIQFNKAELQEDREKIIKTAEPITNLVDTKIAHIDFNSNIPEIEAEQFEEELDKFNRLMNKMFEKYKELLQADEINLCPNLLPNWKKPIKRAFAKEV